jgi:hypothetical protein
MVYNTKETKYIITEPAERKDTLGAILLVVPWNRQERQDNAKRTTIARIKTGTS